MTDRPEDVMKLARETVERLFADLRDRRFLKWLFDERGDECLIDTFKDGEELRGLDLDVQEEIKAAWAKIIAGEEVTAEYVAGPNPRFSPERPYGITIITDDEPALSACLIDKPEAGAQRELRAIREGIEASAWHYVAGERMKRILVAETAIARIDAAISSSPLSAGDAGEIERLRKALEPFAAIADNDIGEDEDDDDLFATLSKYNRVTRPTVGMFRAARAALEAAKGNMA